MGLDQYGLARKGEPKTDEEGFTFYEDEMEDVEDDDEGDYEQQ